jgi:hypothetical protein
MIIKSEATLNLFRVAGECEWCGLWLPRREPHHCMSRGHAGGTRLDIPACLTSLCPFFQGNNCHLRFGDDPRCRPRFLKIVADREGFDSGEAVWDYLQLVLRTPKGSGLPVPPCCPY